MRFLKIILFVGLIAIACRLCLSENESTEAKTVDSQEIVQPPESVKKQDQAKPEKKKDSDKKKSLEICGPDQRDFSAFLLDYAKEMEERQILYKSEPLSDCSGIFLRLCAELKKKCPDKKFPMPKEGRDTRQLARWFFENNKFQIIENAVSSGDLIKPGAVMFYGTRGVHYAGSNLHIDKLTIHGGIQHVGVVTQVKKDAKGQVVNYTLFHGRTFGKVASSTRWHQLKPSRDHYPPLGNGDQQWVGVGELF